MSAQPLGDWDEAELVMISALEHWSYCPRQCALIHSEQTFDENLYTLRGRMLHDGVDIPTGEIRDGTRIERALPLWSIRLGLIGKADVVEFNGKIPYPVEYKHGRRRHWGHDDLQLCAQALCLEEMTGSEVLRGAIYHHGSRRRREVVFDEALRIGVLNAIAEIRKLLTGSRLPPPVNDARCQHCSLQEACLPSVVAEPRRVRAVRTLLFSVTDG